MIIFWPNPGGGGGGVCDYPAAGDVRSGVVYGSGLYTGTYTCPDSTGSVPATTHSPADIIRWLLVRDGLAANPPGTPWPAYYSNEPSSPDNLITTYNTTGKDDGRFLLSGERFEHHGVQVRIRAATDTLGYAKAKEIAEWMDEDVYQEVVTIDSISYIVHSISRTGDVLSLGKDTPNSKRTLFTINCMVTITPD